MVADPLTIVATQITTGIPITITATDSRTTATDCVTTPPATITDVAQWTVVEVTMVVEADRRQVKAMATEMFQAMLVAAPYIHNSVQVTPTHVPVIPVTPVILATYPRLTVRCIPPPTSIIPITTV